MSGQRSTSVPVAPAWSKWMWVSSSARGWAPSSAANRVSTVIPGPGSIKTPSTSQQRMPFSAPLCRTAIPRMAFDPTTCDYGQNLTPTAGRLRFMASTRDAYLPGVPCWIDLRQPDPEAARSFYGGLFGWRFTDEPYSIASLDGRAVAAIAPGDGPGWNMYVA